MSIRLPFSPQFATAAVLFFFTTKATGCNDQKPCVGWNGYLYDIDRQCLTGPDYALGCVHADSPPPPCARCYVGPSGEIVVGCLPPMSGWSSCPADLATLVDNAPPCSGALDASADSESTD
jgi:hypothetical protein